MEAFPVVDDVLSMWEKYRVELGAQERSDGIALTDIDLSIAKRAKKRCIILNGEDVTWRDLLVQEMSKLFGETDHDEVNRRLQKIMCLLLEWHIDRNKGR